MKIDFIRDSMDHGVDFRPKSGDFHILNPDKCKDWKKDGHKYRMRIDKDGYHVYARSFNIIKVNNVKVIKAYYLNGSGLNNKNIDYTPKTFFRRAYWRIGFPKTIFIHYLDVRDTMRRDK